MRKLIIIRSGKHVVPGRMAGGRVKCQVAQIARHLFCLYFAPLHWPISTRGEKIRAKLKVATAYGSLQYHFNSKN
jgi:hypothetical protein